MKTVICHSGRQHSHQLAMALADEGMLAKYITGVPAQSEAMSLWSRRLFQRQLAAYAFDIDPKLVHHLFISPIVRKVTQRIMSSAQKVDWGHRGDAMFDWLAARHLKGLRPDIVVCYENSALKTFQAAKKSGAVTILDAAALHHTWQDRFYSHLESPAVHQRIVNRKEHEIKLADFIFTASEFARESYLEAGIPERKVLAFPLGVEIEQFKQRAVDLTTLKERPLSFAFVGRINKSKGMDTLRDAITLLNENPVPFRVCLYGNSSSDVDFSNFPQVKLAGWIPHERLSYELQQHDVLLLPSRHESFGMVVPEAMACGLPVIVTQNVGAKELVTPNLNGQIIPAGDPLALAKAMKWFIENTSQLPQMSQAARTSAERYSWSAYRQKIVAWFKNLSYVKQPFDS